MNNFFAPVAAFLAALLYAGPTCAQWAELPQSPSVLAKYTNCPMRGGLAAVYIDRAPRLPMVRPVETACGHKSVSVADGYRVILAFPDKDPFVNLKIEISTSGRYELDKQTILEQMQFLADDSSGGVPLERARRGEVDIASFTNPDFTHGVISFYTLFNDKKNIVASAYILNQKPERRAFQDMQQYRALRDRFIDDLVSCISSTHQE